MEQAFVYVLYCPNDDIEGDMEWGITQTQSATNQWINNNYFHFLGSGNLHNMWGSERKILIEREVTGVKGHPGS